MEQTRKLPTRLGDLLYANESRTPVPEQGWVALVQSIAAGDQFALHALYDRVHRIVFTLNVRITANRETAEELTVDVFHDIWRYASRYDAANGTVLGWIMNQTRSRAIDHLRFDGRKKRHQDNATQPPAEVVADPRDVVALRQQGELLHARLALRIAGDADKQSMPPPMRWFEPEWETVAPGIECKLLATDTARHRASMLVRLAPGATYPAHTHAGVEELHLLNGELWIDERKLFPGDYSYSAPGTSDDRVCSETGCTCVLITSTRDILR